MYLIRSRRWWYICAVTTPCKPWRSWYLSCNRRIQSTRWCSTVIVLLSTASVLQARPPQQLQVQKHWTECTPVDIFIFLMRKDQPIRKSEMLQWNHLLVNHRKLFVLDRLQWWMWSGVGVKDHAQLTVLEHTVRYKCFVLVFSRHCIKLQYCCCRPRELSWHRWYQDCEGVRREVGGKT